MLDNTALEVLAVTHVLTGCWTFGLGNPCGIFLPTLLSGAALGRLFGQGLLTAGIIGQQELSGYAILGAAGLLAGVARITISLSVILMESVRNQTFALPLFMTTLVAKLVGHALNEGIYDSLIKLRKIPLMELGPGKHYIHMRAQDVMATDLVTLQPVEEVRTLIAKLEGCRHNGFPVVEATTGIYLGLARRAMLERVLAANSARGGGSIFQEAGRPLASPAPVVHLESLRGEPAGLSETRAALGEAELRSRVDLRPFMNDACHTVTESTSVTRCHELFRTMGLRHVPVVSRSGVLRGVLTRKDLIMASEFLHAAGAHQDKAGASARPCAPAAGKSGPGSAEAGSAVSV
jgi:chloride channel 7